MSLEGFIINLYACVVADGLEDRHDLLGVTNRWGEHKGLGFRVVCDPKP